MFVIELRWSRKFHTETELKRNQKKRMELELVYLYYFPKKNKRSIQRLFKKRASIVLALKYTEFLSEMKKGSFTSSFHGFESQVC